MTAKLNNLTNKPSQSTKSDHIARFLTKLTKLPKPLKLLALLLWVGSIFVTTQFLSALILTLIFGKNRDPLFIATYSIISFGLITYLTIFLPAKFKQSWHTNREELGLVGLPTWTDLLLSPIAFTVFFLLAITLTAIFTLLPWFNPNQIQDVGFSYSYSIFSRVLSFIVLVIVAPITEELIFRGWLYSKLRARANLIISVLLNSLLFATLHGQWNVAVNVFALSLVLCLQREITGTIYSGILLHMIKNGIAFFALFVLR